MFAWRRAVSAIVIALFALALGVAAHAQLGLIKKAITKPPTPPTPAAQRSGPKLNCAGITPEMVDRLLKAFEAMNASLAQQAANERAQKTDEDARDEAKAQKYMDLSLKQAACWDAVKEKDPRSREAVRLSDLANAAVDKGDEKLAEKYNAQASVLNDALDDMSRKACSGNCEAQKTENDPRGKEAVALEQQAAKETDQTRKAGLQVQAQALRGQIRMDASTACGPMSVMMPSAEEEAASAQAGDAAQNANQNALSAALKAGDFNEQELARLIDCVKGRIDNPDRTPMDPSSAAAIDSRRDALKKSMGQGAGKDLTMKYMGQ